MVYLSMFDKYRQLTKDEFYELLCSVADYVENGNVITFSDRYVNMLYQDWIKSIDKDFKKYNEAADRTAERVAKYRAKKKDATEGTENVEMDTSTTQPEKVAQKPNKCEIEGVFERALKSKEISDLNLDEYKELEEDIRQVITYKDVPSQVKMPEEIKAELNTKAHEIAKKYGFSVDYVIDYVCGKVNKIYKNNGKPFTIK